MPREKIPPIGLYFFSRLTSKIWKSVCPRVLLIEKYKRAKADHTTNEVAISLGNGEPCFRIKPRDLAKEPKKQQRKGK